jgi:hypothetical protein
MAENFLQLDARTLLRILRKDTLLFEVPKPQVACFVVLYTNNATVGPAAKDIVFGFVHTDRLQDRDALTEQITPEEVEHIRIADGGLFRASNESEVTILPNSGNCFYVDDMHPGPARHNVHSDKRPMPPTHQKLSRPAAQEDLG